MPFLSKTELTTHIYAEVMDAITNSDDSKITAAIDAAIGEAKGYMSKFDHATIFAKTAGDRDPILLLNVKDIAKWHFIQLANPNIDWEAANERYKSAVRWLEKITMGRIVPVGWPIAVEPGIGDFFHVSSTRPKRNNNY
jgi:phage gp36-like protein